MGCGNMKKAKANVVFHQWYARLTYSCIYTTRCHSSYIVHVYSTAYFALPCLAALWITLVNYLCLPTVVILADYLLPNLSSYPYSPFYYVLFGEHLSLNEKFWNWSIYIQYWWRFFLVWKLITILWKLLKIETEVQKKIKLSILFNKVLLNKPE